MTQRAEKIPSVTGTNLPSRKAALSLVASVITLILLFTAQDAMRRTTNGLPINWSRSLAINAIDWCTWGALAAIIAVIGRSIRLDRATNRLAHIAAWAVLCVVCSVGHSVATGLIMRELNLATIGGPPGTPMPQLQRYLIVWSSQTFGFNMIIFLMVVGAFHAALYYGDLRARQLREADLEARLARAELNVLRMQLQPHFFFNALHTVSSLMVTDVPAAHRVITAIGDLLRSSIDHTARQEIPLGEELAFVGRYIDIQKARFRNRLDVHVDAPDELHSALVPSLVLQPLVENAIRHGIEAHKQGGAIWIHASRRNGRVELSVHDDASDESATPMAKGVGLSNIEGRLAQLYGAAQSFRAGRSSDGRFEVVLTLPYHTE